MSHQKRKPKQKMIALSEAYVGGVNVINNFNKNDSVIGSK